MESLLTIPTVGLDKSARVLHHGEAQIHMGMLRKRREYLVLTESQLVRFKNGAKAAESFPEYVIAD